MKEDEFEGISIKRETRVVSPKEQKKDSCEQQERNTVRPDCFADYPGQPQAKDNLMVYVKAAQKRNQALDHILLHGPPGLGKTTLANIVAKEMKTPFYNTSGPSIDRPGDLAGILAGVEKFSILFIDEIHRLSIQVEEVLYSAMEDFSIDLIVGQGPTARSVSMPVAPFTLIGATTRMSSLSRPLQSRFGIQERLQYYSSESLALILQRTAHILGIKILPESAEILARRSRGTPRIANRLLRRVWDFSIALEARVIDSKVIQYALERLNIDAYGLDYLDKKILSVIGLQYKGGPVGIETIAVTLGEERATIEEVYEPYLVHSGLINRGPRGRSLTDKGRKVLEHP